METKLKFFYNGIKANGGNLHKCAYSIGTNRDNDEITIYSDHYARFSKEIREFFTVENDTDSMTDYFENDRIRVSKDHILYKEVLEAFLKQEVKAVKRIRKRGYESESKVNLLKQYGISL